MINLRRKALAGALSPPSPAHQFPLTVRATGDVLRRIHATSGE